MNNPFLEDVIAQMTKVSEAVQHEFGDLNEAQLNWKPNAKSWSVGQCLDHIIVSNRLYTKIFNGFINGTKTPNFFEKMGLFSGLFAKMLKRVTGPQPTQKIKTAHVFEPTQSEISPDIVANFLKMNEDFKALILGLDKLNLEKTIMSSPVSDMIVYSVKDACIILGNHEERHLNQARNIMKLEAFPKKW